ncbi:MAG: amino acid racemase [Acidobacteriota bacterium]|nr:amino acid racemase [Acidobacteriota bacterium]
MKTLGILGGMGPEASVRFLELVIRNTEAAGDRDHIPAVLYSRPQVPDRTAAILYGGDSPAPWLIQGITALEAAGADILVMPCVTAHHFWPQVAARTRRPFVNILEEALRELREIRPEVRTVGLLATTGTLMSRVVHAVFEPAGLKILTPSDKDQALVMTAVFGKDGVKAGTIEGRPRDIIRAAAGRLIEAGAEAVMAGCTEIPLVLRDGDLSVPFVEPMRAGARACIREAGGRLKPRSP